MNILSNQMDSLKQDDYTKKLTTKSFLNIMLLHIDIKEKVYMQCN